METELKVIFLFLKSSILICLLSSAIIVFPSELYATSSEKSRKLQPSITDYRSRLNPRFNKTIRRSTKFIIVHTSECDLEKTLKIISKGKQDKGKWITNGGHAHYTIAPDGTIFRILDEKYIANHAGLSMWNGITSLNSFSVGIEIVGYHNKQITKSQYKSIQHLIDKLKARYQLQDPAVLTHSQVAYSKPNEWVSKNHRGRKYCASNFDRELAGLSFGWSYDPDVKAGRLSPDPMLSAIFYNTDPPIQKRALSGRIAPETSAWAIAGKEYNSANTLYRFPNGLIISGNRIETRVGWHSIPDGTIVYCDLN